MKTQDRLKLYSGMYDAEHGQRESLRANVTGVVTILTLLGGGLFFYLRNMPLLGWSVAQVLFVSLLVVASAAILLSVAFTARAWQGHAYGYVAPPNHLERWFTNLQRYATEQGKGDGWVEEEFLVYLIREFGIVTDDNRDVNAAVAKAIYRGKGWMLVGLFCLALDLPIYQYCVYNFGKATPGASVATSAGRIGP